MPIYLYQEILEDGTEGEIIEIVHSVHEPALMMHPDTGRALKRVFSPPNLGTKHTEGATKNLLDPKNVEKAGFSQYQRDPVSGKYHKAFGKKGPEEFIKPN